MLYIIDGYNLLNVADVPVPVRGPANLEKARLALLNFLAESLAADEVPRTVVVFDAHDPPSGVPREMRHKGLLVRFAPRDEEADALIEDLIKEESSPHRLTVVSSDHRIQRAAKRRRAGRSIATFGSPRSCVPDGSDGNPWPPGQSGPAARCWKRR